MIEHSGMLIDCLFFYLKMVMMILQEILLMSITLVEMKDFNALIDRKPFFDQPIKNKQEADEKLI